MIVVCKIVMKNIVFALLRKARASKRSSVHANLSVGNKCFLFSVVGLGEMPNFSAQTHSVYKDSFRTKWFKRKAIVRSMKGRVSPRPSSSL